MTAPEFARSDLWRRLDAVIAERVAAQPAGSYVAELVEGGHPLLAGKVIEEAYELIEACAEERRPAIVHEAADLVFHTLVLLQFQGIPFAEVEAELAQRFGISGLTERAARSERPV